MRVFLVIILLSVAGVFFQNCSGSLESNLFSQNNEINSFASSAINRSANNSNAPSFRGSCPTSVVPEGKSFSLNIFPSKNRVNGKDPKVKLERVRWDGMKIARPLFNGSHTFSSIRNNYKEVNTLPSGHYMYRLTECDGKNCSSRQGMGERAAICHVRIGKERYDILGRPRASKEDWHDALTPQFGNFYSPNTAPSDYNSKGGALDRWSLHANHMGYQDCRWGKTWHEAKNKILSTVKSCMEKPTVKAKEACADNVFWERDKTITEFGLRDTDIIATRPSLSGITGYSKVLPSRSPFSNLQLSEVVSKSAFDFNCPTDLSLPGHLGRPAIQLGTVSLKSNKNIKRLAVGWYLNTDHSDMNFNTPGSAKKSGGSHYTLSLLSSQDYVPFSGTHDVRRSALVASVDAAPTTCRKKKKNSVKWEDCLNDVPSSGIPSLTAFVLLFEFRDTTKPNWKLNSSAQISINVGLYKNLATQHGENVGSDGTSVASHFLKTSLLADQNEFYKGADGSRERTINFVTSRGDLGYNSNFAESGTQVAKSFKVYLAEINAFNLRAAIDKINEISEVKMSTNLGDYALSSVSLRQETHPAEDEDIEIGTTFYDFKVFKRFLD